MSFILNRFLNKPEDNIYNNLVPDNNSNQLIKTRKPRQTRKPRKPRKTRVKRIKNSTIQFNPQNQNSRDPPISDMEMNNCSNFCSGAYIKRYKEYVRDLWKNGNEFSKPKTDEEINTLLQQVDYNKRISDCKETFCNPKCGENQKSRYVCPACEKAFPNLKNLGAITYCKAVSQYQ